MNIGEHIKSFRISKGLTQAEISAKSGVALRTIQRIENSEVNPSIYSLNAIGSALDVNLNEIQIRENDKKIELKIIVSNFGNLLTDSKTLIKRNWKTLIVIITVAIVILFFKDLKSILFNTLDNSSISASTINCGTENECDIELVKRDVNDKIIWNLVVGGTSYDKAGQVVKLPQGDYLLVGSTSSFGKGNYDVIVVKVSSRGEVLWHKTYGEFLNDYGLRISVLDNARFQIEGTQQVCKTVNVSNDCYEQEWIFRINEAGFPID